MPILVKTQKFCDNEDLVLIYFSGSELIVLGFRTSILDSENIEFLGERRIPFRKSEKPE